MIQKALRFAAKAHAGQERKFSGDAYLSHPVNVFVSVSSHGREEVSAEVAAAALLHDVIEDCGVSMNDIEREFSPLVADLVGWMTNPSIQHPELSREERKAMDRAHIASAPPIVKLLKACDRLDNVLSWCPADPFAARYAAESQQLLDECLQGIPEPLRRELQDAIHTLATKAGLHVRNRVREEELCPPEEDG